ncbi:MAG: tRNA pseudouridine(55) synthase TruB [Elusimicrobiaceae bacterium]|nr:tRNA pseudouridine(55) synthase TruB [Elusimicrobiaceae bacterium]
MLTKPAGLLLIDKPQDFTSNDVVALSRRILRTKCIGHSGTLDPMATGLLILLLERPATRLQEKFLKLPKVYQAELTLGTETDTWDAQGEAVKTLPVPPLTLEQIRQAAQTLTGKVRQQIPPFSAKKINGRKMYDLAREGTPVQDRFNEIEIFSWTDWTFDSANKIGFTLHCSCGTYVRAMALMLARQLGTTGHLTALRRLSIGPFHVDQALDGLKLKTAPREEIVQFLQEPVL